MYFHPKMYQNLLNSTGECLMTANHNSRSNHFCPQLYDKISTHDVATYNSSTHFSFLFLNLFLSLADVATLILSHCVPSPHTNSFPVLLHYIHKTLLCGLPVEPPACQHQHQHPSPDAFTVPRLCRFRHPSSPALPPKQLTCAVPQM